MLGAVLDRSGLDFGSMTALDLACHQGWFALQLARRGFREVLAVDCRDEHLADTTLMARVAGAGNVRTLKADIEEASAPDIGEHDVTLMLGLLYHLENPVRALRLARAATRHLLLIETQVVPNMSGVVDWGAYTFQRRMVGCFGIVDEHDETHAPEASAHGICLVPSADALAWLLVRVGFARVWRVLPPPDGHAQLVGQKRADVRRMGPLKPGTGPLRTQFRSTNGKDHRRNHGTRIDATTAGPRGRERLRPSRLQREQPRAGAGDHGGGRRDRQPGDHAGLGRRAEVRRRDLPQVPDRGGRRRPTRSTPVAMHQDHGQSPAVCEGAIKIGFSSVMMDGSLEADGKTIASYEYNVNVTKQVVDMAHRLGVSVEGELGCLGSLETMKGDKEDGHGTDATMTREMLLTDPEQAADFVKKTGVDALAIAIGTSHGAYKFTRKPTGDILAIDRIKAIHARIPNTHLVMHGSSSRAAGPARRSSARTAAR